MTHGASFGQQRGAGQLIGLSKGGKDDPILSWIEKGQDRKTALKLLSSISPQSWGSPGEGPAQLLELPPSLRQEHCLAM